MIFTTVSGLQFSARGGKYNYDPSGNGGTIIPTGDKILLEDGDDLLLENDSPILLEGTG